jgi:hypothetical protein
VERVRKVLHSFEFVSILLAFCGTVCGCVDLAGVFNLSVRC